MQIYCKSDVLATGAVLVDLPGTGDSNRARNRVAEDYMSRCERLWIVAPIDRILDSTAVRGTFCEPETLLGCHLTDLLDLLDDNLKPRQLSALSVYCLSLTCIDYTFLFLNLHFLR